MRAAAALPASWLGADYSAALPRPRASCLAPGPLGDALLLQIAPPFPATLSNAVQACARGKLRWQWKSVFTEPSLAFRRRWKNRNPRDHTWICQIHQLASQAACGSSAREYRRKQSDVRFCAPLQGFSADGSLMVIPHHPRSPRSPLQLRLALRQPRIPAPTSTRQPFHQEAQLWRPKSQQ
jgi:hypothetical protein